MQFFLLGLVALVLTLLAVQGFTRANPAAMARQMRLAGGALSLAAAAIFMVRGMVGIALWDGREALAAHFETPHMRAWITRREEVGFFDREVILYELGPSESV